MCSWQVLLEEARKAAEEAHARQRKAGQHAQQGERGRGGGGRGGAHKSREGLLCGRARQGMLGSWGCRLRLLVFRCARPAVLLSRGACLVCRPLSMLCLLTCCPMPLPAAGEGGKGAAAAAAKQAAAKEAPAAESDDDDWDVGKGKGKKGKGRKAKAAPAKGAGAYGARWVWGQDCKRGWGGGGDQGQGPEGQGGAGQGCRCVCVCTCVWVVGSWVGLGAMRGRGGFAAFCAKLGDGCCLAAIPGVCVAGRRLCLAPAGATRPASHLTPPRGTAAGKAAQSKGGKAQQAEDTAAGSVLSAEALAQRITALHPDVEGAGGAGRGAGGGGGLFGVGC